MALGRHWVSSLLGVLLASGFATTISENAFGASDQACSAGKPYVGVTVATENRQLSRFMMVSAYHLEPYTQDYLQNVLADLGRRDIRGIVYGTLGASDQFLRKKGLSLTENELNTEIYREAKAAGDKLWLQVRMYDNQLALPDGTVRNVTAQEILTSPVAMNAYLSTLRSVVSPYNKAFSDACVIVLFEEAGIYHAPQGGGTFWSSKTSPVGKRSQALDQLFADNLVGLYLPAFQLIKSINPKCSVGVHLGHSVFDNRSVLTVAFDQMRAKDATPDFIFYDFYLKSQPDFSTYSKRLTQRADFMLRKLHIPAVHLAQLQTMNHFQHGFAQTPSREELDAIVDLDEKLGFKGVGFYTKNATPTGDLSNEPLDPNTRGQSTVYDSSKDRWDYGMLKLDELGGMDFRHEFDLVVETEASVAPALIEIKNIKTGNWDKLGTTKPAARQGLVVFRDIDARSYLEGGRRVEVRVDRTPGTVGGETTYAIWVLASQPSASFRTGDSLAQQIAQTHTISDSRGRGVIGTSRTINDASICVN